MPGVCGLQCSQLFCLWSLSSYTSHLWSDTMHPLCGLKWIQHPWSDIVPASVVSNDPSVLISVVTPVIRHYAWPLWSPMIPSISSLGSHLWSGTMHALCGLKWIQPLRVRGHTRDQTSCPASVVSNGPSDFVSGVSGLQYLICTPSMPTLGSHQWSNTIHSLCGLE